MLKKLLKFTIFAAIVSAIAPSIAAASAFDIPAEDMDHALRTYMVQSGLQVFVPDDVVKGLRSNPVKGNLPADEALVRILYGTGLGVHREDGIVAIVRNHSAMNDTTQIHLAATPAQSVSGAALETVTVTSSKIGGDIQNIPISITALSQEQLTSTQTAGGPDLIKQVPNMSFTKTNFSGYSIQLRGIGTQAISVTTDPAVAVAFNDIPFIRNHFFEQEFYDVSQVQVLRGPQGTLYGRNATAGVVNLESAKPTDQFEAMASADIGNYGNRRLEGMINIPIVDDWLDLRVAGEWTKRQGYSFDDLTNARIDGRDLWSGRVSLAWKPFEDVQTNLVWEHFSEDDDRMRSAKQLCKSSVTLTGSLATDPNFNQGCELTSLYSPDAFQVPSAYTLAYYAPLAPAGVPITGIDVYAGTTQSRNLRVIESTLNPVYKAKNDTVELNTDYKVTPALTFTSQTGFNHDFLWSTEDYNRFNGAPDAWYANGDTTLPDPSRPNVCVPNHGGCSPPGIFCDPQLGCSDRLVAEDLSDEHAWQLSQEFRLSSNFSGPLNFSVGGNFLHYETEENYYVFINSLTLLAASVVGQSAPNRPPWVPGVFDNQYCLIGGLRLSNPLVPHTVLSCDYIDPNPISHLNNEGHNYFLSQNPYTLNSYAGFGEVYYNVVKDLKLTAGLRWTDDQKHFTNIPSELVVPGWGYAVTGVVNQQWEQFTGRAAVNWTPKLDFTDQTLVYGSYAHGYKAGGANPPGAVFPQVLTNQGGLDFDPVHPLTFKPEFVDAFELGSKNTLLDGALTLNADVFYYNYESYQISEIVDRTAINLNFNAHVKGAEIESTWEPVPGLRFNFAGGWEDTALAKGDQAVDLMDRTAGTPGWVVVRPYVTMASNCILPLYVINQGIIALAAEGAWNFCPFAYDSHIDPSTGNPYQQNPIPGSSYPGFDPNSVDPNAPANVNNGLGLPPNNGEGFDKNLSGHKLPNAPPFTVSWGAQYTIPLTPDWAGTARADYYWQDYSWARVFNDNPYDRLRGYTNVNLTLIFTNQNGWQVMLYDKNIFNTTAITGDFLNGDDSDLTTNVFLTDPKLIGIRVTKNW